MIGPVKTRLLIAFTLSVLVFIVIFYLSSTIIQSKLSDVALLQENIKLDTLSLETETLLTQADPCSLAGINALAKRLGELSPKIDHLEANSPKNPEISLLKKYYSVLEIKHWLAVKQTSRECNVNYTPVLFFYSNLNCDVCQEQGATLSYMKEKYPELMIYSFDVDLAFSTIDVLKEMYNITHIPALVIYNQVYDEILSLDEMERVILRPKKK